MSKYATGHIDMYNVSILPRLLRFNILAVLEVMRREPIGLFTSPAERRPPCKLTLIKAELFTTIF